MNDMTPEALRKFPTRVRWGQTVAVMTKAQVDAAASAWEADRSRIEALERERDEAIAEVRFQTEHGLTSWVLDAVLQLGWTPPAALAAGVGLAHTREEEAMSEMTPEKAETRVVREGYCYLCEADLNEGRGHRDYCPWPNIRAAWEADRSHIEELEKASAKRNYDLAVEIELLKPSVVSQLQDELATAQSSIEALASLLRDRKVQFPDGMCQFCFHTEYDNETGKYEGHAGTCRFAALAAEEAPNG